MHACRGASDGRQERDAVIVSVMVAVCVQFPISGFVEWGVRSLRCVRVRESAVKVGVSCATSDSVVGDAQIKDKVTRACRVGEVADDFADSLARLVPGLSAAVQYARKKRVLKDFVSGAPRHQEWRRPAMMDCCRTLAP